MTQHSVRNSGAQWSVSGIVEAPVERVWDALVESNPYLSAADRATIAHSETFTTSAGKPGEGRATVEVDRRRHQIAVQGEWWYRGVHSVEPHLRGSLVTYEVYNVAPGIGWWAAQLVQGRANARTMASQLQSLLNTIGQWLGCKVSLLSS